MNDIVVVQALANFVEIFGKVMTIAIFVRAMLSWFPIKPDNALVSLLNSITDPILSPLRRIVPAVAMIDLTPMIAIMLLVYIPPLAADMIRNLA